MRGCHPGLCVRGRGLNVEISLMPPQALVALL